MADFTIKVAVQELRVTYTAIAEKTQESEMSTSKTQGSAASNEKDTPISAYYFGGRVRFNGAINFSVPVTTARGKTQGSVTSSEKDIPISAYYFGGRAEFDGSINFNVPATTMTEKTQ